MSSSLETTIWPQLAVIAAVSASHMSMPNHWLPYSLVARAHGWSLQQTLLLTFMGAFGHVTFTVILCAAISGLSGTFLSHEVYTNISSGVLFTFGAYYLFTYFVRRSRNSCCEPSKSTPFLPSESFPRSTSSKRSITTKQNEGSEREGRNVPRAAAISLVLLTTLSPCVGSMPVLISVLSPPVSVTHALAAWCVLLGSAAGVMCSLAAVSFLGAGTFDFARVRRHERLILGAALVVLAALTMFVFSAHDHHAHGHHAHDHHAHVAMQHPGHGHGHVHGGRDAEGHGEDIVVKGDMKVVIDGKRQTFGEMDDHAHHAHHAGDDMHGHDMAGGHGDDDDTLHGGSLRMVVNQTER